MFSSYHAEDVTILLKDITGLVEPLPTPERERRIQSGTHYSEMLPLEYRPSPEYLRAYRARTIYISERFPKLGPLCRYSEWSFWLSLCEKIINGGLTDCKDYLNSMLERLRRDKNEINKSPWLNETDFSRIKDLLA